MATTSRVPAAMDAIVALVQGLALDGVKVVDGPSAVNVTERDRIHIGWQPGAESAASLQQQWNAAGARTRDESFAIPCYAESRGGDKDMAFRRRRVFEMVAAVEQALRATNDEPEAPTLNNTVLWSELTVGDLFQSHAEGAIAGLSFTIACRARI
ncbi:hypothetical protein [Streptomyces caniscabiei]|uniref:Uncharacterized protein n=1 Tax=Streptomyces caniscabiei TaxID=2746961 RepID=A0ABU4ML57_9ACTN|nr:hypothetical protein [Streptomyces caniscabiei]MBE4790916.1 hypothetical protein [Streptomyces caniscabiei]MDX2953344.1 hypothetical protein [Streptomyces caniscabiei]MDX2987319.1 hypothetical protein [Streptomyces caniscabiei]MDX3009544.1 hypothetical protein [Streptomyces caniscabiei]MDX3037189.1 hypothetical protein [Streptomyces caniscabiei]